MSEIEKKALEEKDPSLVDEALDDAAGGVISKESLNPTKGKLYYKPTVSGQYEPHWAPDDPLHKDWETEKENFDTHFYTKD